MVGFCRRLGDNRTANASVGPTVGGTEPDGALADMLLMIDNYDAGSPGFAKTQKRYK